MKIDCFDDQMKAILVVVIAYTAIATALGIGDGKSLGRGEVMVSAEVAKTRVARSAQTPPIARVTENAKRPVGVVAQAQ
ncbi:hypothetical protein OPU71_13390 [Niveibacterium sp. 24ML]|uniref:hypothetical protein n=1 Tax=Niveibacterium sp. 24ML TaxID=2985512 RepID=UPI00226DDC2F|nr:hypothetical protein [Niveibacterium sp. 24ML]MCX9157121.1 hypothetical protein [Niveibacterium sp. 24ML]